MSKPRKEIPLFDLPIIETHFHLDMLKTLSREEVVARALAQNIEKMITISTSAENLDEVIEITKAYEALYCTQGLHPHDGQTWNEEVKAHMLSNLRNPDNTKIVAVGEIGLDYHYTRSPKEDQIQAFREQLQIAIDFDLPVVIHTRDADEDTMTVLKEMAPALKRKGVIHSFTSGLDLCQLCLDLGFSIGFNGIITFKTAQNVRDALEIVPLDRILLETDAPFLTPDPYRGVENAPYYLPFIAQKVAEVKNVSVEEVLKAAYTNSINLFKF